MSIVKHLRVGTLMSGLVLLAASFGNTVIAKNKTAPKNATAKPKWVDPQNGKIWGKVNVVQIPVTAIEDHILGPVKSVRYADYKFSDDGSKVLDDSGYNVYDKAGHLIDQNEYNADGQQKWKCTYKYENGRATVWNFNFYDRDDSENTTFKYDSKGRKIEKNVIGSKEEDCRRYVYTYDDKGNEIVESEYYGKGDKKPWTSTYTYDKRGFQIEYVHRDETGRCLQKMTQEYDDNGNKTGGGYYTSDTTMVGRYKAKLDNKGRVIERQGYKKDGSRDSRIVIKYDDWDNVIEYTAYNPDGTIAKAAATNMQAEFEYDSHGNAVKSTWYKVKDGKKVKDDMAVRKYEYYSN
jgi:hypothetical protein